MTIQALHVTVTGPEELLEVGIVSCHPQENTHNKNYRNNNYINIYIYVYIVYKSKEIKKQ